MFNSAHMLIYNKNWQTIYVHIISKTYCKFWLIELDRMICSSKNIPQPYSKNSYY